MPKLFWSLYRYLIYSIQLHSWYCFTSLSIWKSWRKIRLKFLAGDHTCEQLRTRSWSLKRMSLSIVSALTYALQRPMQVYGDLPAAPCHQHFLLSTVGGGNCTLTAPRRDCQMLSSYPFLFSDWLALYSSVKLSLLASTSPHPFSLLLK